MNISYPAVITSRLQSGVRIGESEISIAYGNWTDDGRIAYQYWLDLRLDGKRIEFSGDDLASGVGGGSLQDGLESLLSFLGACGDAYDYAIRNVGKHSENADLFPEDVAEWCAANSDELAMLACELEETANAIDEFDE